MTLLRFIEAECVIDRWQRRHDLHVVCALRVLVIDHDEDSDPSWPDHMLGCHGCWVKRYFSFGQEFEKKIDFLIRSKFYVTSTRNSIKARWSAYFTSSNPMIKLGAILDQL